MTNGINPYLTPYNEEKKNHHYYGNFFALKNFPDGWESILYKKLLNYCNELKDSGVDIEIFEEINKTSQKVQVIIKENTLDKSKQEQLLKITTSLQNDYLLTPIEQKALNIGLEEKSLPVELEKVNEKDYWYQRQELQTQYAKIILIEYEISQIEYLNNKLIEEASVLEDEEVTSINQILLENYKKNLEKFNSLLQEMTQEVKKQEIIFMKMRATQNFNQKAIQLKVEEAKIITSFGDKPSTSILELITDLSDLTQKNKALTQENKDFAKKLLQNFEQQITEQLQGVSEKFEKLISNMAEESGINIKDDNFGILTDYTLDENKFLVEANILGNNSEKVIQLNEFIKNFSVEGYDGKIRNIKVLKTHNLYISSFYITTEEHNKICYYLVNEEYKYLEIEGDKEFASFSNMKTDENGKLISGQVKKENGKWKKFHLKNGEYKYNFFNF